jgi:hypothetical protein
MQTTQRQLLLMMMNTINGCELLTSLMQRLRALMQQQTRPRSLGGFPHLDHQRQRLLDG